MADSHPYRSPSAHGLGSRWCDPCQVGASGQQLVLQSRIPGGTSRLTLLTVVEVLTRHVGLRIVTDCQPDLCAVALFEVTSGAGPPIFVGTQPGSIAFESTSGQRRAKAKARSTS